MGNIVFIVMTFISSSLFATVNLETGEHRLSETDLIVTKKNQQFKMIRYYNHRADTDGLLGKKWCYEFDQSMKIVDGGVVLSMCGQYNGLIYKKGKTYFELGGEKVFLGKDYTLTRKTNNNELFLYGVDGRLVTVLNATTKKLKYKLIYGKKTNRLENIHLSGGYELQLLFSKEGVLSEIRAPNNISVIFDMKNHQLLSVNNIWNKRTKYKYDLENRLISLQSASSTAKFRFNKNNIVDAFSEDGCVQNLQPNYDIKNQKLTYTIKSSCTKSLAIVNFTKSPLFVKNRVERIRNLEKFREPASISAAPSFKVKKNKMNLAETIEGKKFLWKVSYIPNTDRVGEVEEFDKATKQKTIFKLTYQNGVLQTVVDSQKNGVQIITRKEKIVKINYLGDKKKGAQAFAKLIQINKFKGGI